MSIFSLFNKGYFYKNKRPLINRKFRIPELDDYLELFLRKNRVKDGFPTVYNTSTPTDFSINIRDLINLDITLSHIFQTYVSPNFRSVKQVINFCKINSDKSAYITDGTPIDIDYAEFDSTQFYQQDAKSKKSIYTGPDLFNFLFVHPEIILYLMKCIYGIE